MLWDFPSVSESTSCEEGGLSELDAATVMQQVLRGVAYMHAHKSFGFVFRAFERRTTII